jgi:hypothetical protein
MVEVIPPAAGYGVLGPFAPGSFLHRVYVQVSADAASAGAWGIVVGSAAEESAASYAAGKSLIDRCDTYLQGQPSVGINVGVGISPVMVLTPGIRIDAGSQYAIAYLVGVAPATGVGMLVTVEVMRYVSSGGGGQV